MPNRKRLIEAYRMAEHIRIDGNLDEEIWSQAKIAHEFTQYEPFNGSFPSEKTEVRVLFNDNAIYIGAILHDDEPDNIFRELGQRDNSDRVKADAFTVLISPYNDGINYFEFIVSASGVQTDIRHTGTSTDRSWDAVWDSKVSIIEGGWIAELKIPFSALRFSSRTNGNWGINFRRLIKRYNEWSSWNPIDNSISGIVNQSGELTGISNIDTPIRLSVSPYISTYLNKYPDAKPVSFRFNGGMDLKYGISESFTLDMALIPDFGQVKSDDKILNISPYEVQYSEQRPFFTEGMDLFQKGGIFYSRRIGSKPRGYNISDDDLLENEIIAENPLETKMINATKVTGRTNKGLGVGFFNAMTSNTYATIHDTISNDKRHVLTQGFTNYNMLVFDQTLRNNSYLSLVNTNFLTPKQEYIANVTGTDFIFRNKKNSHSFSGNGALSQIDDQSFEYGYKHYTKFEKTSGNFLYNIWSNTESKNYNPNDMGFLQKANEFNNGGSVGYRIYKPFWHLLNWTSWIGGSYKMLHDPRVYNSSYFYISLRTTVAKTYHYLSFDFWMDPTKVHDYDEPRVDGRMVIIPQRFSFSVYSSTDYRNPLAFDTRVGYIKGGSLDYSNYYVSFSPRIRFSNNTFLVYEVRQDYTQNSIGYVDRTDDNTTIYMGLRDVSTLTNTFDFLLSFTANSFLNLRARHYWRWLDFNSYHELNLDGTLSAPLDNYTNSKNINYNLFNLDLTYQWNFAPGSILSVVWKNAIERSDSDVRSGFLHNWGGILESSQINSISLKMLYYLDYHSIMKGKGKA